MTDTANKIMSIARGSELMLRTAARAIAPGAPSYLIFFITHRCNAACAFCFNRWKQEKAGAAESELTLDQIHGFARRARALHVTLTGGEPFMRDDVAGIARAFVEAGARSLTIATNGVLTQRILAAARSVLGSAPGLFFDLDVSIDGPPEVHDKLRCLPGAHEKAMTTARSLAGLQQEFPGFRVGATVTVSAFNQATAEDTVRGLQDSGLFQRVQVVWVRGAPFDPEALRADFAVYERCASLLGGRRVSRGLGRIKESLSGLVRETVGRTVREDRMIMPCRALRSMVTVDAAGLVYPCEMLSQLFPEAAADAGAPGRAIGSLRESDYDLKKIMSSERARRVRGWIEDTGCYCSFECAAYNNIVFSPRQWPAALKRLL